MLLTVLMNILKGCIEAWDPAHHRTSELMCALWMSGLPHDRMPRFGSRCQALCTGHPGGLRPQGGRGEADSPCKLCLTRCCRWAWTS
jgi:hypothetical protein